MLFSMQKNYKVRATQPHTDPVEIDVRDSADQTLFPPAHLAYLIFLQKGCFVNFDSLR